MKKINLTDRCMDWLREYLADEPKDSKLVRNAAMEAGFTYGTLAAATRKLEIVSEQTHAQHRTWRLPTATSASNEVA